MDDKLRQLLSPLLDALIPDADDGDDSYGEKKNREHLRWFRAGLGL
jgi:hypothetical protein